MDANFPCVQKRKRQYTSRKSAKVHAKKLAKKYGTRNLSYKCPQCGWFHLTSHPRNPTRTSPAIQSAWKGF